MDFSSGQATFGMPSEHCEMPVRVVLQALARLIYGTTDLLSAGGAYLGYLCPCGKRTGRQTPLS